MPQGMSIVNNRDCNEVHIVKPASTGPTVMIVHMALFLHLSQTTKKHAGESAVQLSVGAEMEAYGDQEAAASN